MLFEKYNIFHTGVQPEKIAQARANVKLAAVKGNLDVYIKETFEGFSKEAMERVAIHLQGIQMIEKNAQVKEAIGDVLKGMGAAFGLAPLFSNAARGLGRNSRLKQSLASAVRLSPELAQDPDQTARNFELIAHFAPDIAEDSNAVGPLLKQLHALGPSAITLDQIKKLIEAQKLMRPSSFDLMSGAAKSLR